MKIEQYNHKSLTERVYEAVRNSIVTGELEPGSLHSANSIAELLSVSRTPVREALLKLEDQGLVQFERNRGARILQTSLFDMRELISLRMLLEAPSAYTAAQKISDDGKEWLRECFEECNRAITLPGATKRAHLEPDAKFHKAIAVISGSKRLALIIESLFDQQVISDFTSSDDIARSKEIMSDHRKILDAIIEGNPEGAAIAMRDHLLASYSAVVSKEIGSVPSDVKPIYLDYLMLQTSNISPDDKIKDK